KDQSHREGVRDEVNLVPPVREGQTELRRDDTAAAVGGIAGDADPHGSGRKAKGVRRKAKKRRPSPPFALRRSPFAPLIRSRARDSGTRRGCRPLAAVSSTRIPLRTPLRSGNRSAGRGPRSLSGKIPGKGGSEAHA